jgi:phosphoglucosamine mutase
MFEYALVSGITASGADAYLMHVSPTPSISYIVKSDEFDCGIMISASHNPYYDNGIKIINGQGFKLEAEVEQKIEDYIDGVTPEIPFATRENIGRTVDYFMGRNRYIAYLMTMPTRAFKNMRVGLDCANGASSTVAKGLFEALGAEVFVINNKPDGTNINDHCGSTYIKALQKHVVENHLDVGFAYDGDADRCIAVDDKGEVCDGDKILYVCGLYLKECGRLKKNTVVTTVMSNMGLYKAFDEAGISYAQTTVGDKYVYECMAANGYILGGEQSGHIIFSEDANTGDGVLTSLKIMEVMMKKKESLSNLVKPVKIYPQLLKNIRVKSKPDAKNDPDVIAAVKEVEEALAGNGRILIRESGTEPLIRVMVEAETDELCKIYVDQVIDVIKSKGHEE